MGAEQEVGVLWGPVDGNPTAMRQGARTVRGVQWKPMLRRRTEHCVNHHKLAPWVSVFPDVKPDSRTNGVS
jgi:hypothetical protein